MAELRDPRMLPFFKNKPQNEANDGRPSEGPDLYKMFWIFLIGSFVGCLLETGWFLLSYGLLEYRASLMFMPLALVYGVGAVALYLGLHNADKKAFLRVFLFGVIAGTLVEFCCSYLQELVFGSISWNYADTPFNIAGRVCLRTSLVWGALAVVWVRWIQPLMVALVTKIPKHIRRPLTYAIIAILIVCILLSALAVARWEDRIDGLPSMDRLSAWLDTNFTNKVMEYFYPGMIFLKK